MTAPRVTFLRGGRPTTVEGSGTLLELARQAEILLPSLCGGRGKCAKCACRPAGPLSPPSPLERELLPAAALAGGTRLACQARPEGAVTLPVREEALDKGETGEVLVELEPSLTQAYLRLPPPVRHEDLADVERLRRALGPPVSVPLDVLRRLPGALRAADFAVTATLWEHPGGRELLAVEPGDSRGRAFGLAFDIGTTSVVGYLVDLLTGRELARASRLNGQQPWGADVLSRASHAMESAGGLEELQRAVAGTMNRIAADCLGRVDPREVYLVTLVGNSLMHHLALRLPPDPIAVSPYIPVARDPMLLRAGDLGLALPNALVYVFPLIGAYVGADTLAVILATGLDQAAEVRLAVDIGTNGEMVLGSRQRILACSAPAGPAFEGAAIRQGMRAAAGAIDRVRIAEDVRVWTIGEGPPQGLCGSGLIDAVAEMLRHGLVEPGGRLLPRSLQEGRLPPALLARLVSRDGGWEFVLSQDPYVAVTQEDIRQVQLAKGTIRCGIRILMAELGVGVERLGDVALAGAFGNYLDPRSAQAVGLFPPGLPLARVRGVGNAAGHGALMGLLSRSARARAEAVARRVEYFELSKHPQFEDVFLESLRLTP